MFTQVFTRSLLGVNLVLTRCLLGVNLVYFWHNFVWSCGIISRRSHCGFQPSLVVCRQIPSVLMLWLIRVRSLILVDVQIGANWTWAPLSLIPLTSVRRIERPQRNLHHPSFCVLVCVWILTALQLHDAGLDVHWEVLQIHRTSQDQRYSANTQKHTRWGLSPGFHQPANTRPPKRRATNHYIWN